MISRIQVRRGTAAEWAEKNPILSSGEFGYETDANRTISTAVTLLRSESFTGPPTTGMSWTIVHRLNTTGVLVQVREIATEQLTGQVITILDANTVRLDSGVDMAANAFIAVIHG